MQGQKLYIFYLQCQGKYAFIDCCLKLQVICRYLNCSGLEDKYLLVGEGLNTVLETVESTLGAPDPEELANQERVARGAKEPDETPNGRSECSQGIEKYKIIYIIHVIIL